MKNRSVNDKTNRAVFCWFYLYIDKINFYTEPFMNVKNKVDK
ncbi:hypothetical protein [Dethiothermospora halolimnae]